MPLSNQNQSQRLARPLPVMAGRRGRDSWQLVRAIQLGDADAFADLYQRYVGQLYRYVRVRVFHRQLAEDLVSETFLRAFIGITDIRYQGRDVGAWLQTIARNLIRDHLKSAWQRREFPAAEVPDRPTSEGWPETAVTQAETVAALRAAIDRLTPDQRECVTLRFLQGRSIAETAGS